MHIITLLPLCLTSCLPFAASNNDETRETEAHNTIPQAKALESIAGDFDGDGNTDAVTIHHNNRIALLTKLEQLNVAANGATEIEPGQEGFVRGDASRNTEGSGLGLNIAQSLMELQKGQLELLVDGDLFKVTLVFPAARME